MQKLWNVAIIGQYECNTNCKYCVTAVNKKDNKIYNNNKNKKSTEIGCFKIFKIKVILQKNNSMFQIECKI